MSQKMSVGALAPQASLHAVARGKSAYLSRRLRAGVLSIGVLFLLIKFLTFLTGPPMLDIHIDLNGCSDAVDPDDIWDEVSQCCLAMPCVIRVRELDMAEWLY